MALARMGGASVVVAVTIWADVGNAELVFAGVSVAVTDAVGVGEVVEPKPPTANDAGIDGVAETTSAG